MTDVTARRQAVEPQRSVIVQAPAGSGKTTLLVERYLGLLGVVEAPEEILAITFTRKAAAEMRQRILTYLDPDFASDADHEQSVLAKARALRDRVEAWRLMDNPQRLLIRTIDSFNHYLARTMPVASALGPVPAPADNTRALYRQAARNVLNLLETDDPLGADLERLLDWRDHRSQDIENLLAGMLGRRDQWLRALDLSGAMQRAQLEAVLRAVVESQLADASRVLRQTLPQIGCDEHELLELLRFAARSLLADQRDSAITVFADAVALPGADSDDLDLWSGLAAALLTAGKAAFRKTVDVRTGFPAGTPQRDAFRELLDQLSDHERLGASLHRVRNLPAPRYSDAEWAVLESLVRVLIRSASELEMVFARTGQTDYTGLAAAALRGLGDEDGGYTDLGLYLDRRIRHLLVDEYQDTNWGQLHLLEKLTAGWEAGDGRSLFLVGDPMQSIYRFREAEVGLFIRSRDQGIGPLTLDSLRLTRNFRSREEIVSWVNGRLGPIFPQHEDVSAGAVAYAASEPGRGSGGAVQTLAYADDASEAEAIAALLQRQLAAHADDADFTAAIIVRARSHLREILPALTRHGIPYRAVKLDPLLERSVVQDLLALTRVILLPTDQAALLAVLRSPVCGLTLADLHALAGDGRDPHDLENAAALTADGRDRAARVLEVLADARAHWQRRPLRDLVEGAWHALGGPACCLQPERDLKDAGVFLDSLELAENDGLLEDFNDFLELLEGEHTEGDPPSDQVRLEILTMHGAKGLEWDLVVVPGLNRRPASGETALLHWLPFTDRRGDEQILLAPLRAADEASNPPLVELIGSARRARAAYENQRLLYVATTRARERLVLTTTLDTGKDEFLPANGSLLADLWPTTSEAFLSSVEPPAPATDAAAPATPAAALQPDQRLRRINSGWRPDLGSALHWQATLPVPDASAPIEYDWAGFRARRSGIALHRLLERVGVIGIENLSDAARARLIARIPFLLQAQGLTGDALEQTAAIVQSAFEQTMDSATGRWLLSNQHEAAACELAVSGLVDGRLINAVIDRTFVDADGVRWIIDYKSGYHAGADLDAFLAQESERYREQLHRYRRLFSQLEARTISTALYLPRHGRLQQVEAPPDGK